MYVWVVYVYVFVYVHLHVSYVNVVGVCVACVCGGCPKHRDCANTLVLYIYIYIYIHIYIYIYVCVCIHTLHVYLAVGKYLIYQVIIQISQKLFCKMPCTKAGQRKRTWLDKILWSCLMY